MSRAKLLVLSLVAAACTGCKTLPVAVVPTPWVVVGAASFESPGAEMRPKSTAAVAIEAQRHIGLVSESDASRAAALAAR
jgi:hypothetical protein